MSEPRSALISWLRRFAALWGTALFVLFVLVVFRAVILPFVLGVVVAYVLSPVVARLSTGRRSLPRWASIIVVYVGIAGGIALFFVTFVPYLSGDFARLIREAPPFFRRVRTEIVPRADSWLEAEFPELPRVEDAHQRPERKLVVTPKGGGYEISLEGLELEVEPTGPPSSRRFVIGPRDDSDNKRTRLADFLGRAASATESEFKDVLIVGQRFIATVIKGFAFFILTFMVAAYILADVDRVMGFLRSLVPPQHHGAYDALMREFDRGLSSVIRGQLIICAVNAVLTTAGLLLFHVKYSILLGLLAGGMSFIPVFGSILSSVPIVTVALTSGPAGLSLSTGLAMLAWIVGIHLLEANFFNPKIIGSAAKIHPVVVVFSLLVGEQTGGLIGALLAVPIASMVQAMFLFFPEPERDMKKLLLGLLLVAGCAPKSAPEVADRFVDLYFVEIDQRRALPLTSGPARQKIEEEMSLVADIRRTYEPDQAKPSIFYARQSQQESGDHARFTYDLTIRQGRDETHRNALISAERVDGKWTIANFIVQEGHLLSRPQGRETAPSPF